MNPDKEHPHAETLEELREKPWAEQRQGLLSALQTFPAIALDIIDSAYLSGLDASTAATEQRTWQRAEEMAKKVLVARCYYPEETDALADFISQLQEARKQTNN